MSIHPWDGFPTVAELVEHYRQQTSRDMSNIEWYGVLACFKTGIILEGTNARAEAGLAPKNIGEMLHEASLELFERAWSIADRIG